MNLISCQSGGFSFQFSTSLFLPKSKWWTDRPFWEWTESKSLAWTSFSIIGHLPPFGCFHWFPNYFSVLLPEYSSSCPQFLSSSKHTQSALRFSKNFDSVVKFCCCGCRIENCCHLGLLPASSDQLHLGCLPSSVFTPATEWVPFLLWISASLAQLFCPFPSTFKNPWFRLSPPG